jgi:hypothetical protein
MKVYVVATIQHPSVEGDDLFSDIILITTNEDEARTIKHTVKERRPYPGLDYDKLAVYNDVIYFERELGKIICMEEDTIKYKCELGKTEKDTIKCKCGKRHPLGTTWCPCGRDLNDVEEE